MQPIPLKFYDDPTPFELVKKHGFYQVGNEVFSHKINALIHATQTRQEVKWNFNEDVYRGMNWRVSNNINLYELYRRRAQQLRDQYDYLILSYGGGSDSTTILDTFLENGIHLDEIVTDWPLSRQGHLPVTNDISAANVHSEWALTMAPKLERVRQQYPRTLITAFDTSKNLTPEDQEDTANILHHYYTVKRYRAITDRIRVAHEKYNRPALIMGIDKPIPIVEKNVLCLCFIDNRIFLKSTAADWHKNIENFYWTPDMPEITREQGHAVLRFLQLNPQYIRWFKPYDQKLDINRGYDQYSELLLEQIIYPRWDITTFQTNKDLYGAFRRTWQLIHDSSDRSLQSWETAIRSRVALVDPKFYRRVPGTNWVGSYVDFMSRLYPIGILSEDISA